MEPVISYYLTCISFGYGKKFSQNLEKKIVVARADDASSI